MNSPASLKWSRFGTGLGLVLAVVALLLLVAAPIGWRAGWWHYRIAFFWLMTASGYLALAAAALCVVALAIGRSALGRRSIAMATAGLVIGAVLAYVPWQYNRTLNSVPRIHDISTDTDNPPTFVAALPARAAEQAAPVAYEGAKLAEQQKAAYPDLAPLKVALGPTDAFKLALEVARTMPGWAVVDSDAASGRIEANQASRWFAFVDDVVIRVTADGAGSKIDMRSVSRQGRSDFGVNARRIRAYLQAVRERMQ